MKHRIKKGLIRLLGNQAYGKLDLWLKILRVYWNRLLSAKKIINLHPSIKRLNRRYIQLQVDNAEVFFGYYDHSPVSVNGNLCLAMKIDSPNKVNMFNKDKLVGEKAAIGYFDLQDLASGFHKLGDTHTWCWQQGARLRWFPEYSNQVIYNCVVGESYGAVIQDLDGRVVKRLKRPVYDLNNAGDKALSLNFSRLQRLRPGYGYSVLSDTTLSQRCPANDGVWLYDIESEESRLLFSLEYLAKFDPDSSMIGAEHYINHLSWNLSGDHFLFFHIWCNNGKRYTRVLTCDAAGSRLTVLIAGSASHYCWLSDTDVMVVTTVDGKLSYKKFDISNGEHYSLELWMPPEDGHPSVLSDRYIITDTYPDKYGQQHLLLCDSVDNRITTIGSFYASPLALGEVRCDLHPRSAPAFNQVVFDSAFSGRRTINVLSLDGLTCDMNENSGE
ncbi:hypothetical protein [Alkalimarinus coralli]|uniref:hypothetical protein n=1 Tax=Alkalimarinus coralli TaxID=2935863 RepID=UPI00202AE264|nr:hypothetical protein [Alkalimarinus coralli]